MPRGVLLRVPYVSRVRVERHAAQQRVGAPQRLRGEQVLLVPQLWRRATAGPLVQDNVVLGSRILHAVI